MDSLVEQLRCAVQGPLGVVVHVGGDAGDLAAYAALAPQQLHVAQADARRAAELAQVAPTLPYPVHVVRRAIAPASGPLRWHRYSVSALDGPVDAEPMRAIYPRLARLAVTTVDALGLSALLAPLRASAAATTRPHLLVLDVPGQESALLASLAEDELEIFEWIACRHGGTLRERDGRLEHDTAPGLPEDWLAVHSSAAEDALWPVTVFRLDRQARQSNRLLAQLVQANAERDAAQDEVRTLARRCEALAQQLAAEQAQRVEAERRLAALEALHGELQAQSAAAAAAATRRDADAARVHMLETELQRARQAHAEAQAAAQEHESTLQREAEAQRVSADAAARSAAEQAQALQARIDELNDQLGRLRSTHEAQLKQKEGERARIATELADARRAATLATRLQMLRENDLRDLQGRHDALQRQAAEQQELLSRLAQRLTQANQYFQQLAHEERGERMVEAGPAGQP